MSLNINIETGNKKQIAMIIRSIADLIEASANKRITIDFQLKFLVKEDP